jgi:type VI protein secretion system component Hcp
MNNLVAENNSLKERNTKLSKDLDSTSTELNVAKTLNDTLKNSNSKLAKTIEKGQKLALLNLQMLAVKQKSSGKQIPTDKASKADVLKVSFSIAENQIAKKGDRTFYVQIIDSKSNVLGDKKGENLNGNFLSYSFLKTIKYENKTTQIQEDLPVKNLKEGTFFVNVFDKDGNVVVKSSFDLK